MCLIKHFMDTNEVSVKSLESAFWIEFLCLLQRSTSKEEMTIELYHTIIVTSKVKTRCMNLINNWMFTNPYNFLLPLLTQVFVHIYHTPLIMDRVAVCFLEWTQMWRWVLSKVLNVPHTP